MINIGIVGYGNLGRGTEASIMQNEDMTLVGVFTRRHPSAVSTLGAPAFTMYELEKFKDTIDVLILCGGSATDLPVQMPALGKQFCVVDSYDTHAKINGHFAAVDKSLLAGKKTGIISVGWDPGLFSINRILANSILPEGETYTFWGDGVSQGHSDAIRRVPHVLNAIQYTLPIKSAIERVRSGENPVFETRDKHTRLCYVVAEDAKYEEEIRSIIVNLPNYFSDYDTTVNFITEEELKANHSKMAHGGFVIRSGKTGASRENNEIYEFALKLDSNPEFTASVLVAYARACVRMYRNGDYGCKTVFDVPPAYLSPKSASELRAELL